MNRREILKSSFKILSIGFFGGFIWSIAKKSETKIFLRPPGALEENGFLKKCIKCGLCVKACPYKTLKLANFEDDVQIGTPFLKPRKTPCYMCEDIPCVDICPTSALDKNLLLNGKILDPKKIKMGIAVIDTQNCVAYWGIQCDVCYRACPLIDKAIFLDYKRNDRTAKHAFLLPNINSDFCTGCGKCEKACITQKAAIYILPTYIALGKVGTNYVKGWDKNDENRIKNADTKINSKPKKAIDYLNNEVF